MNVQFGEMLWRASNSLPWDVMGWIAGVMLIVLLSAKELLRASDTRRPGAWMWVSNTSIVPLLMLFGVSLAGRVLFRVMSWAGYR